MRKNFFIGPLCSLLLLGGGCLSSTPGLVIEHTVDSAKVNMVGFDERAPVDGAAGCAVSASYPIIVESPGLKEEIRTRINRDIKAQVALYFDAEPHVNARDAAEAFLQSCAVGIADVLKTDETSFVAKEEWNSNLTSEMLKNSGGIFSIALTDASYMGEHTEERAHSC
jgi:hypothetical protein